MEYFIGAVSTLIVIVVMRRVLEKSIPKNFPRQKYSQSSIFEVVRPVMPFFEIVAPIRKTQSRVHYQENKINVLLIDDKAYWIKDNTFYYAEIIDGFVDQENAKVVDIMGMDKVELDKMSFIVSKLTEGNKYDSWNPGNS